MKKPVILNYQTLLTHKPTHVYDVKFRRSMLQLITAVLEAGNYIVIIGYPDFEDIEDRRLFSSYMIYEAQIQEKRLQEYTQNNLIFFFSLNKFLAPPAPYALYAIAAEESIDLSEGVMFCDTEDDKVLANKLAMTSLSTEYTSIIKHVYEL